MQFFKCDAYEFTRDTGIYIHAIMDLITRGKATEIDVRYEATSVDQFVASVFGKCADDTYFLYEISKGKFCINVYDTEQARLLWDGRFVEFID
jgi:hypothetical protein